MRCCILNEWTAVGILHKSALCTPRMVNCKAFHWWLGTVRPSLDIHLSGVISRHCGAVARGGGILLWCVMLTMVAVLIWPSRQSGVVDRLRDVRSLSGRFNRGAGGGFVSRNGWDSNVGGGAGRRTTAALPRSGIAQVLASAIARMAGGGTLVEAFEEQFGGRFAVRRLTPQRLTDLFERRRLPDESRAQSVRAAMGAAAAATVSEELGCRAVPCLEAVLDVYSHMRLMQNMRAQAFAVPQATVGLLSALPAIAVVLGELMGAHPLLFLFGSQRGLVCLVSGGCCYVVGLVWMRALMRDG